MNIENTQSQMRKGILEFCILSIIRRGEAYPSDIVEEMKGANPHISGRHALSPPYPAQKRSNAHLPLGGKQLGTSPQILFTHSLPVRISIRNSKQHGSNSQTQ
jgi:hypothetical protein